MIVRKVYCMALVLPLMFSCLHSRSTVPSFAIDAGIKIFRGKAMVKIAGRVNENLYNTSIFDSQIKDEKYYENPTIREGSITKNETKYLSAGEEYKFSVLHTEIRREFIQKVFVKCYGKETAAASVDNITVFIGNKTFYYPKSAIAAWERTETEDGVLFQLPLAPYAKSVIKPWINWYGDLNFALSITTAFLYNPLSFPAALLFVILFVWLLHPEMHSLLKKHGRKTEMALLCFLRYCKFLLKNAVLRCNLAGPVTSPGLLRNSRRSAGPRR